MPSIERYVNNNLSFTIVVSDDESVIAYVSTKLQSFRIDIINSNGGKTYGKIIRKIRNNKMSSLNEIIGDCKKSVTLTGVRHITV